MSARVTKIVLECGQTDCRSFGGSTEQTLHKHSRGPKALSGVANRACKRPSASAAKCSPLKSSTVTSEKKKRKEKRKKRQERVSE
jgi:hypothetical protein